MQDSSYVWKDLTRGILADDLAGKHYLDKNTKAMSWFG